MFVQGQGVSWSVLHHGLSAVARLWPIVFIAATGAFAASARAAEPAGSVRFSEAVELGTFNVGPARAAVRRETDRTVGEILKLEYTIPRGAAAGVYAKAFPGRLDADRVDLVRLAVEAETAGPSSKRRRGGRDQGLGGRAADPLTIHPDEWKPIEVPVDWPAIGAFREVVVSVDPQGDGGPASGFLRIDGRFDKLPLLRKLSMSPPARIGGVLLASLVVAMLIALARAAIRRRSGFEPLGAVETFPEPESSWVHGLRGDLFRGGGTVFIALLAIEVIAKGGKGPLEAGWGVLAIALAGAAIAEWWKFGLTGRHLTPREVFRDMAATGLPAASASTLAILQAPAAWSELLLLSQTIAATTVLIYHAANAYRLAATRQHLGARRRRADRRDALPHRRPDAAPVRRLAARAGRSADGQYARGLAGLAGIPGPGVRRLRLQRGRGQRAGTGHVAHAVEVAPRATLSC